ncbi:MAG: sirohydrochlorin chelatase [Synechococcaceae cyanobacterium SM2_3_1]|nr:sirohydrochlorin chelatase [Synechococcaceae cyanobacterium SM2_3_1]
MSLQVVLICHGSRDPRYQASLAKLAAACRAQMPYAVATAQLELASLSLDQQLIALGRQASVLVLLPLFMGPGIHLQEDLKTAIAATSDQLPALDLQTAMPLGQDPGMIQLLAQRLCSHASTAWILLSHGSRVPTFAAHMQRLRRQVIAVSSCKPLLPAFWTQPPSLTTQVERLIQRGIRRIEILPFFLFAGHLQDQITTTLSTLQEQYPEVTFGLHAPLATDPALIPLLQESVEAVVGQLKSSTICG